MCWRLQWMKNKRRRKKQQPALCLPSRPSDPAVATGSGSCTPSLPEEGRLTLKPPKADPPRRTLWSEAYDRLKEKEPDLIKQYEKCLLAEPEIKNADLERGDQLQRFIIRKSAEKNPVVGKKSIEVRKHFNRIAATIKVIKPVGDSLASLDPVHAGLPWAGVCLIVSLLGNDTEQRTIISNGLEEIETWIIQYSEVERLYLESDSKLSKSLRSNLVHLFTHILKFQARVVRHYDHTSATQTTLNTLKIDDWSGYLDSIRTSKERCNDLVTLLDSEDGRVRAERLEQTLVHIQQEIRKTLQNQYADLSGEVNAWRTEQQFNRQTEVEAKCHQVLRNSDYEKHKDRNPDKVANTCQWVLDHPNYKVWLAKQTTGLLWISADPGCGKSVLSKSLVDEDLCSTNMRTTCYFFFKDNLEQNSVTKGLCALLHQLFQKKRSLIRYAIPAHQQNGAHLPDLFDSLWDVLIQATADPEAGEVVCIMDALDECEESGRKRLIHALDALYCKNLVMETSSLQFIVTSRPYWDMEDSFQDLTNIAPTIRLAGEEETSQISQEIDLVIKVRVNQIGRRLSLNEAVKTSLQKQLLNTEHRTYLWLYLVLEKFKHKGLTETEVQTIISTLPQTVYDAYNSILGKIPVEEKELARKALQIVVAAGRPLTLQEMNIALAIKDDGQFQKDLIDEDAFPTRIRDLCGLFLTIADKKVYLIHQTAKEYLVAQNGIASQDGKWKHCITPSESNLVLFNACIFYLLHATFDEYSSNQSSDKEEQYHAKHGFLLYAARYWATHFQEAKTDDLKVLQMVLQLVDAEHRRSSPWFHVYWNEVDSYRRPPPNWTNLMIASHFGHEAVVKLLLADPTVNPNFRDGSTNNSLLEASGQGHSSVVKLLLADPRINPNSEDLKSETPLYKAAKQGHSSVVKLLLADPRTNPNSKGFMGETPLCEAAKRNHDSIVKLLLANPRIEPNSKNREHETALMLAVSYENTATVQVLLENPRVDPNIADIYLFTPGSPLFIACRRGHLAMIKVLLDHPRVDPNLEGRFNESPLWGGIYYERTASVELMLACPRVYPNLKNKDGKTPLLYAEKKGLTDIIALLRKRLAQDELSGAAQDLQRSTERKEKERHERERKEEKRRIEKIKREIERLSKNKRKGKRGEREREKEKERGEGGRGEREEEREEEEEKEEKEKEEEEEKEEKEKEEEEGGGGG